MRIHAHQLRLAIVAIVISIIVTAFMDFNGLVHLSALSLILITSTFYLLNRPSKSELGLSWAKPKLYLVALLYPILVGAATILVGLLLADEVIQVKNGGQLSFHLVIGTLVGIIMVFLTEEGFFRGWLWATLKKAGLSIQSTWIVTTLVFTIWHISAVTSNSFFGLPLSQVPIYLINAFLMGLIWGYFRIVSDSVLVPSFCHAVWNSIIYTLFGFGEKVGALGFEQMFLLGPEVGYLGIALNTLFLIGLIRLYPVGATEEASI